MNTLNDALKPCAHCGCHNPKFTSDAVHHFRHTIKCQDCPMLAEFYSSTRDQAIAAWNTRANTPVSSAAQGAMGAVEAILSQLTADTGAAHMYPSDLERFQTGEHTGGAFSIPVGCPGEESIPLFTMSQILTALRSAQPSDATAQTSLQNSYFSASTGELTRADILADGKLVTLHVVAQPRVDLTDERIKDIYAETNPTFQQPQNRAEWEGHIKFARALLANTAQGKTTDQQRLEFMAEEECQIEHLTYSSGTRYRLRWPELDEAQSEWHGTPSEAIDAALAAKKG